MADSRMSLARVQVADQDELLEVLSDVKVAGVELLRVDHVANENGDEWYEVFFVAPTVMVLP